MWQTDHYTYPAKAGDLSRRHLKLLLKPSKRGRTDFTLRVKEQTLLLTLQSMVMVMMTSTDSSIREHKRISCNVITGFVAEWSDTTYHTYYCIGVTSLAGRNELQPPHHLILTGCDVIANVRSFIYHEHCDVITNVRSLIYHEQHRQNRWVKWIKFTTKVFWRQRGRRRKEQKSRRYNWGAVTWVGNHLRHCSLISTPSFPRCNCNRDNRARLRNP